MALEREAVSVADIVEGVGSSLGVTVSQRDVALSVFVEPAIPDVVGDGLRLRQVLYNLIGNAIKFTAGKQDQQGRVWVDASLLQQEPPRVRFRVEDNGIGMDGDVVEALFNPFTQGEVSTTRRFGGTGLGLAICKRIVGLMDGEITVESEPNQGSCFTIDIPFERAPEQHRTELPDLTGVHCVLVACDRREGEGFAEYLRDAGAHVTQLDSPDDVKPALADSADPCLIVCTEDPAAAQSLAVDMDLPADVPVLSISRTRRHESRTDRSDILVVDGNGLRRHTLLRNVAVAVGRASPEVQHSAGDQEFGNLGSAPSVAEARAQGRLILIAEDDATNQMVILQQLGLLGYAAEVAHNGVEALDLWRDGGYALLLTDLHMPEMDGYELTAAIRREEIGDRLPIVALTANALRGEDQRARDAGMNDYLTKPVSLVHLKEALERWLPASPPSTAEPVAAGGEAPSQPTDLTGIVDLDVLKGLVGDDRQVIHDLLISYRDAARGYAAELGEASAKGDIPEVGAVAHKLKSASRSIGAMALGDLCACLENAAKTGDTSMLSTGMLEFDPAFGKVDEAIGHLVRED